jgi:hypothetical protein
LSEEAANFLPGEGEMRIVATAFALSAVSSVAFAQQGSQSPAEQFEKVACFEVVPGNLNTAPQRPILLNRCTGATWLLAKEFVREANGKPTQSFRWYWNPLPVGASAGAHVDSLPTGTVLRRKTAAPSSGDVVHF